MEFTKLSKKQLNNIFQALLKEHSLTVAKISLYTNLARKDFLDDHPVTLREYDEMLGNIEDNLKAINWHTALGLGKAKLAKREFDVSIDKKGNKTIVERKKKHKTIYKL
jgi:hypothetical protein